MQYGYSKTVNLSYENAIERITEELKERGFGILTEIDVKATMKKKLDAEMNNYKILGACNPNFAHQMLQMEQEIGIMLPCNVIVYTRDDGSTVIAAQDANAMVKVVGEDPRIESVADQVTARLKEAVDAVANKAGILA